PYHAASLYLPSFPTRRSSDLTFVLSATVESPRRATAISFPSGDTLTSPSPLVAMVGTSWSTGVKSLVLPSASVTVNRCWRLPARQSSQCRHKRPVQRRASVGKAA